MRKHWCSPYPKKPILHHNWSNSQKNVVRIMDNEQKLKSGLISNVSIDKIENHVLKILETV